jgi:hypothetical protein
LFKRFLFSLIILAGLGQNATAQPKDMCSGVLAVLASAPNKFKDIKDSTIVANELGIMWNTKLTIPGAVKCRLVSAMGIRYEAALFQTKSLEALQEAYNKYKGLLKDCLQNKAYKLSSSDNFYPGLSYYKKLMFTKPAPADTTDNTPPPPHVSMEVDYFKTTGAYTIIMNIWEH